LLKVDSWSNGFVVRESPAGKDVSTEAQDIIETRGQATPVEDIEFTACAVARSSVRELVEAL
jgi:hypothetical protein